MTPDSTDHPSPFPDISLPLTTDPPSTSNPPVPKTWLIFGATGHIGRSIVKSALLHNDSVCAVGQSYKNTLSSMYSLLPDRTDQDQASRFLPLLCDVRLRESVGVVIEKCLHHFGPARGGGGIDIIANCTGYGVIGAFEDQDEAEIRNQFETNFMGTLNIIQLSLKYFRERQGGGGGGQEGGGRYVIFSSTSGAQGVPGLAPYCATKYAVEGLIESMLYEVDGFGIRVTLVEMGHVRRDEVVEGGRDAAVVVEAVGGKKNTVKFQTPAAVNGGAGKKQEKDPLPPYNHFLVVKPSPPYATLDSPSKHAQRLVQWYGTSHQPTSVIKAAELVWQLGHCSYPPLRLLLGTYAVESVREKLRWVTEEIEDWKHLHYPVVEGWDGEEEESGAEEELGKEDAKTKKGKGKGKKDQAGDDEGDDYEDEDDQEEDEKRGGGEDVDMDDT